MVKLFVGNLEEGGVVTNEDIKPLFETYGVVTECEVIKNHGYAFIHMDSEMAAKSAVKELNGTEIKGKPMKVEFSNNSGMSRKNTTKIFVGNIKDGTNDQDLRGIFETYGDVTECDIMKEKNFGFVHIDTGNDRGKVGEIIRELNGYELNGNKIRVQMSTGGGAGSGGAGGGGRDNRNGGGPMKGGSRGGGRRDGGGPYNKGGRYGGGGGDRYGGGYNNGSRDEGGYDDGYGGGMGGGSGGHTDFGYNQTLSSSSYGGSSGYGVSSGYGGSSSYVGYSAPAYSTPTYRSPAYNAPPPGYNNPVPAMTIGSYGAGGYADRGAPTGGLGAASGGADTYSAASRYGPGRGTWSS